MTTTDGLQAPAKVWGHLERLRRRAAFLEDQLANPPEYATEAARDHLRADLAALRWVIPVAEAEYDQVVRLHRMLLDHVHPGDAQPMRNALDAVDRRQAARAAG